MLTVQEALKKAAQRLEDRTPTALLDAELLLCHVMDWDRVRLITEKQQPIPEEMLSQFEHVVQLRYEGKPVQYIVGMQEFMGLPFEVSEDVLIPRPDTETLVEKIIEMVQGYGEVTILDIGTGSGAIPVALACYLKKAKLWTVDISEKASQIAQKNAALNHVEDRITFLTGDLYEPLKALQPSPLFDVIVSNPPYIPSKDIDVLQVEVAQHEPRLALDGGEDGLAFYRRLVKDALNHLKDDGIMAFEIGYDQGQAVSELLEQKGFVKIDLVQDLAGKDRVVIGRLPK